MQSCLAAEARAAALASLNHWLRMTSFCLCPGLQGGSVSSIFIVPSGGGTKSPPHISRVASASSFSSVKGDGSGMAESSTTETTVSRLSGATEQGGSGHWARALGWAEAGEQALWMGHVVFVQLVWRLAGQRLLHWCPYCPH